MKKYISEFIGTFFLVLVIGLVTAAPGVGNLAPLAIGFTLMVMVYAGGHISGAHYNPAVTLAAYIRGKCASGDLLGYIVFQIIGAFLAANVVLLLYPDEIGSPQDVILSHVFLVEFLFTFALAYVVLNVATSEKTSGNSFYGLAIGGTVTAGAYSVGNISGAMFNPAVLFGVSLMGLSFWSNIWVYLAASIIGGGVAGILFKFLDNE